jgi:predicted nucleotidyltransferase component of viral defense system
MTDPTGLRLHADQALFREATTFTAAQLGFSARLIEKDYFCTVVLEYLARKTGAGVVFKGGTCLAKVHAGFYRLSEGLDFTIPHAIDVGRTQRRQSIAPMKKAIASLADHPSGFERGQPLKGSNNSTQYIGSVSYMSPATGQPETILIEVSLREPLLTPAIEGQVKTVLLDPIRGRAILPAVACSCISMVEAMAEKLRAALSRRDIAIRDFYDLHHAVAHRGVDLTDRQLLELVRQKLAVPGNPPVNLSGERLGQLPKQLDARLRPVLRDRDLQDFDLDGAVDIVTKVAKRLR